MSSEQSPCSDGAVCPTPFFVWKYVKKTKNHVKCIYCTKVWNRAEVGHATSTIRVHLVKYHFQEMFPNL